MRWKRYALTFWCVFFDAVGAFGWLYEDGARGPMVWLGSKAQSANFWAHNNRIFRWLEPE